MVLLAEIKRSMRVHVQGKVILSISVARKVSVCFRLVWSVVRTDGCISRNVDLGLNSLRRVHPLKLLPTGDYVLNREGSRLDTK